MTLVISLSPSVLCHCAAVVTLLSPSPVLAHPVVSFTQSHLAVLAVGHPLAPSMSSSLASSLASSTGSGGSSPTALPTLSARTHPLDPTSSAGEGVPGKPGALLPLCTRLGTFLCTRVGTRSFVGARFRRSPATRAVLPQESAYLAGRHGRARAAAPPRT